jgi:uncharacterized damage-inducible protein DinB
MEPATKFTHPNTMLSLMQFKAWADAKLIDAVTALPDLLGTPEGQFIPAIVRHFHTVDCVFKAHLLGVPHGYASVNPPEPASLSELRPRVSAIDDWYVDYSRHLDERDLTQVLDVTFTDGARQLLTRSDILLHVSLHGMGHRAQVAVLMRRFGAEPPPDRFTSYLNQ